MIEEKDFFFLKKKANASACGYTFFLIYPFNSKWAIIIVQQNFIVLKSITKDVDS